MERITSREMPKLTVSYSPIEKDSEVELVEDADDCECARAGVSGVVIARHAGVVNGKYFVRLSCGHGSGCTCAVTRDQIRPVFRTRVVWN